MGIQKNTKRLLVAVVGLVLASVGSATFADNPWASTVTAYTQVAKAALPASNQAGDDSEVAYVVAADSDYYDSYTCAAAYGAKFCAAFERCMAVQSFEACYERFGEKSP